jgi:antitoxin (DNA-binding transcriptional repressor) of toxin-antitoxin stability system
MKSIGAYEAKTNLSRLLDEVALGETITITRHGVPVAVLSRPQAERGISRAEAVEDLIEFRKRFAGRGLKQDDIRDWRHEGHKY